MKTLSSALLEAQSAGSRSPCLRVEARPDPAGAVRLVWERVYSGSEPDGPHALAVAGDGSLVRLRVAPPAGSRMLYRQRVAAPLEATPEGGEFAAWTYLGIYNVVNCAACALGSEVNLFWVKSSGEIDCLTSTDCGATWGSLQVIGMAPSGGAAGIAAAGRPNGDLFLFFTQAGDLYVIRRLSGVWQTQQAWTLTTWALTGAAVVYDGDWLMLVSGQDADLNPCLWALVYGDGGCLSAGSWGTPQLLFQAPADSGYSFGPVFLDKPDVYRLFCLETFSGSAAYQRPLSARSLPETAFSRALWTEPRAFDFQNSSGLAPGHSAAWAWLSCPSGVWRAPLSAVPLDLSGAVRRFEMRASADRGEAVIELDNSDGQFNAPGSGATAALARGSRLDFQAGYLITAGSQYAPAVDLVIQSLEHRSTPGRATLRIYAADGWETLRRWKARYPRRWNAGAAEASVRELLEQVLARAGLPLTEINRSDRCVSFYPDFTLQPGDSGAAVVGRLLEMVPDCLVIEGSRAYLVYPQSSDTAVYAYGSGHVILQGQYRRSAATVNRVQVEGRDSSSAAPLSVTAFNWEELAAMGERLAVRSDLNLNSPDLALERGELVLQRAAAAAEYDWIRTPVNCGLELLDVITLTDLPAGLNGARRRVTGLEWRYQPERARFDQIVRLVGV